MNANSKYTLLANFMAASEDKRKCMQSMESVLNAAAAKTGMDADLQKQLNDAAEFLLTNPPALDDFESISAILRDGSANQIAEALLDYVDSFADSAIGFKSSGLSFAEKAAAVKSNKPKI